MARVFRWVLGSLAVLTVLSLSALIHFFVTYPIAEPPRAFKVEKTPEQLERGAYLVEHVSVCTDCHSERDFSRFSAPIKDGTLGKGGTNFGHELGLPGEVIAPNITPYKLSSWSDGEIVRAITSGVTPEGRALFPLMPYQGFAQMCESDLLSVVTYLRKLSPVKNDPPRTELDFPLNLIVRTLPKPAPIVKDCPDANDSAAYGKYLATLASCADCHSKRNGPDLVPGKEFAGGNTFPLPGGTKITSANLTPDIDTGIGSWSKEMFINRFKPYRNPENLHRVEPGERQTIMPWSQYAGMSDRDLGAIYDYLRTQKPVRSDAAKAVAQR
jgi:mono/diheme cytochrome c family protein